MNRSTTVKSDFPALKKKCMFCYCKEICKFMSEGRCTSVPLYHTGQEVTYNALVSAFFRIGAGQNAIPTVIIMFISEHNSTLFVMTHDTQTIGKIAVYDMAINLLFISWFIR